MQNVKNALKAVLKVDFNSYVNPLKRLKYIGSHYHGYFIPENAIHENSVCYCIGAGLDITFDTELVTHFGAKVFIFDPAPEAKNHFLTLKNKVSNGEHFSAGKKHPFIYSISASQMETIQYIETGLWDKKSILKFYKPATDKYPSHSIGLFSESNDFIEAPVDRLKNIMKKLNHSAIDLLKMEIEGAEYVVLNTIVEDKPDIKMILVEFDEIYHPKDSRYLFRIRKATESLLDAGYRLAHSTPYFKRLFVRKDLFEELKIK